jgi:hypothetical protein
MFECVGTCLDAGPEFQNDKKSVHQSLLIPGNLET